MPDANAHAAGLFVVRGTTLPRLWWLNPWTTARTLAVTVNALRDHADRADLALKNAEASRLHWMHRAERAHAVALQNERVIRDMEDRPRG